MSTALIIRYIAYTLYLISFVYGIALIIPALSKGKNKTNNNVSNASGSLGDLMSSINQWAETSDQYEMSNGHSRRVADLARQIGEKYGLEKEELDALECSALLHDIGQINNFDFIQEPRELNFEEVNKLQNHTIMGEQLVQQIANIGSASLWVRWHHERWDGCGYPDQLSGDLIPLPVRILAVADAFDSMTHQRPHKRALSVDEAMNEMQRMAGLMFDPNVVQVFMSIDSETEVGSSLEI